jgi:predicted DNA-binding transcriptional regulator YafY
MLASSARLLRLLSLFQAQRYWCGMDLAARLGVHTRTLRRDVNRLRSLGYPVNSTAGVAGGYQLAAGARLPPLLLEDEEAIAVAVGLRTAASGSISGIEEASVRALAKLEQVLPARLQQRVAALHASILPLVGSAPAVDAATLSAIAGACRDCRQLHFSYQRRDGAATARQAEPHRLVHTGRRWYLVAWDLDRQDWRTFRIDRIQPGLATGARFGAREPPAGGFTAYVSRSVAYAPYPHQVKVILHVPVAQAAERISPAVGLLEAIDERSCLLQMGAGSLDGLFMYIALFGFEFEVRDSPELMDSVRRLAARFTRAAGTP